MNDMLHIPVTARMEQQPDGSWKMVKAAWADIPADAVAAMLVRAFSPPEKGKGKPGEEVTR